jgi:signal transduction histidine kinase
LGLLGRIVAILLLTTLFEFAASTLLYERASRFAIRDDEARRLAEHLVVSRHILTERPPAARPAMASELSTDRYLVSWDRAPPVVPRVSPSLDAMRRQVLAWEPSLRSADLRLAVAAPGRASVVAGGLTLPDGSWLHVRTRALDALDLGGERVLLALIPAVALMLLGGLLINRTLTPLRRLAAAADRMGSGDEEQVPEQGPGEVVRVVRAFNRMQARISRLIEDRTEALAAVGHDLRTPLARLRLRADAVADDDARAAIEGDIAEMEAMIGSVLAYLGGDDTPELPAPCDIAVMCATVIDDCVDRGEIATYHGPDHLEARVRAIGLKRAVVNLVENALHHASRVELHLVADAASITIRVEDNGPGIPEEALARVMHPFVRLDTARRRDTVGFGLGLAIVARLAEAEGGALRLANRPEGGLRADITLRRR